MKVSLVVTVLNEEKTIEVFLDSIEKQTLKPDEVVIVDGGSTDWTLNKLIKPEMNLKVLVYGGSNRSQGRNRGIQMAKNEIIAITDCGCILDKNWLLEITKPFADEKVNAVAGYYLAKAETVLQKCVAPYFCITENEIKRLSQKKNFEFLPSSRSFALRKSVWSKAGGYPEDLDYCEDLAFDQKIKNCGFSFYFAREAIVYWPQRKTFKSIYKQFFNYATGDGQAFFSPYQTHSLRISLIFFRYFLALNFFILGFRYQLFWLLLIIGLIVYKFWSIIKHFNEINDLRAVYLLPIIRFLSDFAIMAGTIKGLFRAMKLSKLTLFNAKENLS